jgi:hypothetical protein
MTPEARLRVSAFAILIIGLAAAAAIYLSAQPPPGNPLGYEPEDTKKYLRDLEFYGGKGNVIATELREWFASLWHGKRLAYTIAVVTLAAAGVLKFLATHLPVDAEPNDIDEATPRGSG